MSGKQFFIVLIATLITVLLWVGLEFWHTRQDSQPSPEAQQLLTPLDPNLDQQVIDEL